MRISDWSSDVCSSDLTGAGPSCRRDRRRRASGCLIRPHVTVLSVNLNKIAVLRNSRGGDDPDILRAARTCLDAGAHGITVHPRPDARHTRERSEEHTSELQSLMRISYAVFCLNTKT